jgi:hypothetical protein
MSWQSDIDSTAPGQARPFLRTFGLALVRSRVTPTPKRKGLAWQAAQVLCALGFAFLSYVFFSHFVVTSVQVVGGSMHPTLHDSGVTSSIVGFTWCVPRLGR